MHTRDEPLENAPARPYDSGRPGVRSLRRRGRLVALAVALLLSPATGAGVTEGLEAYQRGDLATALREWRAAAAAGDASAQYNLGFLYASGRGVERDYSRAAHWYRKAAEAGIPAAQLALASLHAAGKGVERDPEAACTWYERAAEQGLAEAQHRLALTITSDAGCSRSEDAAIEWLRRAADQGHTPSQLTLAWTLQRRRESTPALASEAARWMGEAAAAGSVVAQYALGRLLLTGEGISRDPAAARHWLLRAARDDFTKAQFELGRLLWNGAGVAHDSDAAEHWLGEAARGGDVRATRLVEARTRLRDFHLRNARFTERPIGRSWDVPSPDEIRRGPPTRVTLEQEREVHCELFERQNRGGNSKFRCFMTTAPIDAGGHYLDVFGRVQPAATEILMMERNGRPWPVLAERGVPLTYRTGFRSHTLPPFELKVKYASREIPYPLGERDMHSEVAAARLLWVLGFPADRMYRVKRLTCHRCSADPFRDPAPAPRGTHRTFENVAIELRFGGEAVERVEDVYDGGWSWGDEIWRLRYGTGVPGFTRDRKTDLDVLLLVLALIDHVSGRPDQNRLVCSRATMQRVGEWRLCPDTLLLVHDLGATFGKRSRDSLKAWSDAAIWRDASRCETSLTLIVDRDEVVYPYRIGAEGQRHALRLFDALSDDHLRALFASAGFERFDLALAPPETPLEAERGAAIVDRWVRAFRDKVDQIRRASCPDL